MLHERCLRIIYNDKQSYFTDLLNKGSSISMHIRNIQRFAIEMFRFYYGLSPPLISNTFKDHIQVKGGKSPQLKAGL